MFSLNNQQEKIIRGEKKIGDISLKKKFKIFFTRGKDIQYQKICYKIYLIITKISISPVNLRS